MATPTLGKREIIRQTVGKGHVMKYGDLTLGQIEAIVNKLGGMEGVRKFLGTEPVSTRSPWSFKRPQTIKMWKTKILKLGGVASGAEFVKLLNEIKCFTEECDIHAHESLLWQPSFHVSSAEEREVELVSVSVGELCGREASRREIYAAAERQGLSLCPPEVGPYLRLEYKDQP